MVNPYVSAKPIIPWMGGKRRLAKHILPLFPQHTCYCEPFCGGAAVFFMKEPSEVEVINDWNGELVNLYRVVKHHLEEFIRQFKYALVSRQIFEWLKQTPTEVLTDIQRAARFFYLQKNAFGGRAENQTFGTSAVAPPRMNLTRIEEDLSTAHLRLSRCLIEHLSWEACVRRYDRPGTLFYLDPPYWATAGYGVEFGLEQYDLMADLARTIQGKMVISVNDHPEMRRAFAGLEMEDLEIKYSVRNRRSGDCPASQELLIRNFAV